MDAVASRIQGPFGLGPRARLCDNALSPRKRCRMRRLTMLLAGTICGALVGAVTALLLAPYSGQELRDRMELRARQIQDEVREAYETRRAQLEAELEALRAPRAPG